MNNFDFQKFVGYTKVKGFKSISRFVNESGITQYEHTQMRKGILTEAAAEKAANTLDTTAEKIIAAFCKEEVVAAPKAEVVEAVPAVPEVKEEAKIVPPPVVDQEDKELENKLSEVEKDVKSKLSYFDNLKDSAEKIVAQKMKKLVYDQMVETAEEELRLDVESWLATNSVQDLYSMKDKCEALIKLASEEL